MTDPGSPDQDVPTNEDVPARNAGSDTVVLRCSGMTTLFTDPEGRFPDIDDQGVEMTREQAQVAKSLAAQARLQLRTVRGDR